MSIMDGIKTVVDGRMAAFGDSQTVCSELRSLKIKRTSIVQMLVPIVVLLIMGSIVNLTQLNKSSTAGWVKVEGTFSEYDTDISGGDTKYVKVVNYTVNGQKYSVKSSFESGTLPTITSGTSVVLYNPSDPSKAILESDNTGMPLFIILADSFLLLMMALIVGSFIAGVIHQKKINQLKQTGQQVMCRLTGIIAKRYNDSSNTSGIPGRGNRITYRLVVSYESSGHGMVEYRGKEDFYGAFGLQMANYPSMLINIIVYTDPNNPKNFYIDPSTATIASGNTNNTGTPGAAVNTPPQSTPTVNNPTSI